MNWFKRLFKEEIKGEELKYLLLALGKDRKFITGLYSHRKEDYTPDAYGKIDVKNNGEEISFDVDVIRELTYSAGRLFYDDPTPITPSYIFAPHNIKKSFSHQEIEKIPFLKKYIKSQK